LPQSAEAAATEILSILRNLPYPQKTISKYQSVYQAYIDYAKTKKWTNQPITHDRVNDFLVSRGFSVLSESTRSERETKFRGKLIKLLNFQHCGMFLRREPNRIIPKTKAFLDSHGTYWERLENER